PATISAALGRMRANSTATLPDWSRSARIAGAIQAFILFIIAVLLICIPSSLVSGRQHPSLLLHQGDLLDHNGLDALLLAAADGKTGVAGERHRIGGDEGAAGRQGVVAGPLDLVLREVDGAIEDRACAAIQARRLVACLRSILALVEEDALVGGRVV